MLPACSGPWAESARSRKGERVRRHPIVRLDQRILVQLASLGDRYPTTPWKRTDNRSGVPSIPGGLESSLRGRLPAEREFSIGNSNAAARTRALCPFVRPSP